ncbi:putative ribonuclease H-like domain-containing protein [Tanacetum coccineum]
MELLTLALEEIDAIKDDTKGLLKQDMKLNAKAQTVAVDDKNLAFLTTTSPSSTNPINTVNTGVSTDHQRSQLVHEDLEQLHDDDLEEMDLKWNMALLSMRARSLSEKKKNWKEDNHCGSSTTGYDKSKVECFNCQPNGNFTRVCRWWSDLIGVIWQRMTIQANWLYGILDSETKIGEKSFSILHHVRLEEHKKAKENTDAPIIKDWVLDDEEEVESIPKEEKKADVPIATKKESVKPVNPSRSSLGYAEISNSPLNEKGFVDSGCSRHILEIIAHSFCFHAFDGGYVIWWRRNGEGNHCQSTCYTGSSVISNAAPEVNMLHSEGVSSVKQKNETSYLNGFVCAIYEGKTTGSYILLFAVFISRGPKRVSVLIVQMKRRCSSQTPGFEDPGQSEKVYKVVKALYGLHQAPRAWYDTLATYLLSNGFQRGQIDQTLFIKSQQGHIACSNLCFNKKDKDIYSQIICHEILRKLTTQTIYDWIFEDFLQHLDQDIIVMKFYASARFQVDFLVMQEKKVVATSTTEAEYVAAASCCGQVLWIQNQLLDYGIRVLEVYDKDKEIQFYSISKLYFMGQELGGVQDDEGVHEKASNDTEIFVQEVTPTGKSFKKEVRNMLRNCYILEEVLRKVRKDKGKAILIEEEPKKSLRKILNKKTVNYWDEKDGKEDMINSLKKKEITRSATSRERSYNDIRANL